jgi:threonylcarbamoyladenosine tRNA methylthiotransferase MtaB
LMRMRRFYTLDQYQRLIDQFTQNRPDFNFTTDLIVGFPGETDEEFQETIEVVKKIGFSHIHTFKYSKRSGTRADRMDEQVSEKIKTERSEIIRDLADQLKIKYRSRFIGKEQTVLTERSRIKGVAKGYGEHYIPVIIKNSEIERNSFVKVKLTGFAEDKERSLTAQLF